MRLQCLSSATVFSRLSSLQIHDKNSLTSMASSCLMLFPVHSTFVLAPMQKNLFSLQCIASEFVCLVEAFCFSFYNTQVKVLEFCVQCLSGCLSSLWIIFCFHTCFPNNHVLWFLWPLNIVPLILCVVQLCFLLILNSVLSVSSPQSFWIWMFQNWVFCPSSKLNPSKHCEQWILDGVGKPH